MGAYVVILEVYPDEWSAYAGAQTLERARARRRELPQWPSEKVRIVRNTPPEPTYRALGMPREDWERLKARRAASELAPLEGES